MSCEKIKSRLVGNYCEYSKNILNRKNTNINQHFKFTSCQISNLKFKNLLNFEFEI
jgi:hypothetical protein